VTCRKYQEEYPANPEGITQKSASKSRFAPHSNSNYIQSSLNKPDNNYSSSMSSDNQNSEASSWPLPKFRFEVDFGVQSKSNVSFQEVSGLETETQLIEYRKGDSPQFSAIKMPGISKFSNVTMKKGLLKNNDSSWDWVSEIKMNLPVRRTITIWLLDEAGNRTIEWQLINAWPTKITGTDLKSDRNEIAVELVELVYENLKISMK
jgi:phage tail-like protein